MVLLDEWGYYLMEAASGVQLLSAPPLQAPQTLESPRVIDKRERQNESLSISPARSDIVTRSERYNHAKNTSRDQQLI